MAPKRRRPRLQSVKINIPETAHVELTETGSTSAGVVRAAVAAARGTSSQASVLAGDEGNIGAQRGIDIVAEDDRAAAGRVAGHVLVEHGQDGGAGGGIVAEDCLRSEKTTLLTTIPVELEGVLGLEAGVGKDAKRLEGVDATRAVVISSRGAGSAGPSSRVVVRPNDHYMM